MRPKRERLQWPVWRGDAAAYEREGLEMLAAVHAAHEAAERHRTRGHRRKKSSKSWWKP